MDKVIYNDGFNFNANDLQFTEDSRISSINCLAKSLVKLPGVATGLEITQLVAGSSQLLISLGTAINSEGNLIVTTADQSYAVVAGDIGKYLCLSYTDNEANFEAHPITGIAAATRKLSSFVLITKVTASSLDIILCKIISLNAGNVEWSLLERSCLGLTLANSQVTNLFVAINAAIEERKIAFDDAAGHAHTGQGGTGKRIGYEHLKNLPVIPNPEVANRDLHASGIVSSNPEILKPTGSSAYNAVYFTPTLNNEDCAYIGGKKYTGLLSGGLPLSDLPGVYYNFASTDPAGMYVIFADGLANGLLKAEIILSMTDVQSYYDNKDYMPLCVVTLTSIGVIAPDTVVDCRPFGTIGLKDIWDLYNLQDKVTTIETSLGTLETGYSVLAEQSIKFKTITGSFAITTPGEFTICSISDVKVTQFLSYQLKLTQSSFGSVILIRLRRNNILIYDQAMQTVSAQHDAIMFLNNDRGNFVFDLNFYFSAGFWQTIYGELSLVYR